jgi:hypothetical protein
LPIDISQIYDNRYFNRHGYTAACESSFNFINNSDEEIFAFVKEVLEDRKFINPIQLEEAAQIISIENSYLNALGKTASESYKTPSSSGLDTPIEAKISSKFHVCYRQ